MECWIFEDLNRLENNQVISRCDEIFIKNSISCVEKLLPAFYANRKIQNAKAKSCNDKRPNSEQKISRNTSFPLEIVSTIETEVQPNIDSLFYCNYKLESNLARIKSKKVHLDLLGDKFVNISCVYVPECNFRIKKYAPNAVENGERQKSLPCAFEAMNINENYFGCSGGRMALREKAFLRQIPLQASPVPSLFKSPSSIEAVLRTAKLQTLPPSETTRDKNWPPNDASLTSRLLLTEKMTSASAGNSSSKEMSQKSQSHRRERTHEKEAQEFAKRCSSIDFNAGFAYERLFEQLFIHAIGRRPLDAGLTADTLLLGDVWDATP